MLLRPLFFRWRLPISAAAQFSWLGLCCWCLPSCWTSLMSLLSENQKSQLEIEKMLTPKSFPYEPWHSLFAVVAAAAAAAAAWESGSPRSRLAGKPASCRDRIVGRALGLGCPSRKEKKEPLASPRSLWRPVRETPRSIEALWAPPPWPP